MAHRQGSDNDHWEWHNITSRLISNSGELVCSCAKEVRKRDGGAYRRLDDQAVNFLGAHVDTIDVICSIGADELHVLKELLSAVPFQCRGVAVHVVW